MKEFLKKNLEIKIVSIIFFATEIIFYMLISPFFGENSISIKLAWQMVFMSIVLTALQYIVYTSGLFSKLQEGLKLFLHYIAIVVLGLIFTKVFNWFNINFNNVCVALIIFTTFFLLTASSMAIYAKLTGDKLNEQLKAYKIKKNNNN